MKSVFKSVLKSVLAAVYYSGESIANQYQSRVLADDGFVEDIDAFSSKVTDLGDLYDDAEFVFLPNGYKSSKLYSAKPTDGSGDLAFVRSSEAFRKTETGFELVSNNVPRLDWLQSNDPKLLLEPSRTNVLTQTLDFTDADWTKYEINAANAVLDGANGVWVDGNYAYVASFGSGALVVIDVSDKNNPQVVGELRDGAGGAVLGGAVGVEVVGDYAYVTANTDNALEIVDISDPTSPTHVTSIGTSITSPWNLHIVGDYCYIGTEDGLVIVNISNPLIPTIEGTLFDGSGSSPYLRNATTIYTLGDYCYVASFSRDAFQIVDVSDKANPVAAGSIVDDGSKSLDGAHGVWVEGNYAYLVSRFENSMNVIDVTNKSSPSIVATMINGVDGAVLNGAECVEKSGDYLYICNLTGDSFSIIDVSTPTSPTYVSAILNGEQGSNLDGANRLVVDGNYVYISCLESDNMAIIDVSNPSTPLYVASALSAENRFQALRETTDNDFHFLRQTQTKSSSSLDYILGVIARPQGRNHICLQVSQGGDVAGKFFNLSTGAIGSDRVFNNGTLNDSKIIDLGDGSYLCIIHVTSTTSTSINFDVLISTNGSTVSYAGNTQNGVDLKSFYAQQTDTPLVDSYIETLTTSETRAVDTVSPLTGVSDLIGQTQGTLFYEVETWADGVDKSMGISDGTSDNRIVITFNSSNVINLLVVTGGVTQANISNAGFLDETVYSVKVNYAANNIELFVNDVSIGSDLSASIPACSQIRFDDGSGGNPFYGRVIASSISKSVI